MITEHNFPTLYFPKIGGRYLSKKRGKLVRNQNFAFCSSLEEGAKHYARYMGYPSSEVTIEKIELPYRLEYFSVVIWQKQRYYLTQADGEIGFTNAMKQAAHTGLKDYTWRLIDTTTDTVLSEGIPSEWMVKND